MIGAKGHVVTQIFGELKSSEPWEIEVLFDAGYAVPELRNDASYPAPSRDWLVQQGEDGWSVLRNEAERYLRECLTVRSAGEAQPWKVVFIDFASSPPDFPELLNDGAYFRMKLSGFVPLDRTTTFEWNHGPRPSFVVKLPGDNTGYLTLAPGQVLPAPVDKSQSKGHPAWVEAFRQGFLHVVPTGLDHILFVMGLFFYRRAWRPLLAQSLAFTAAHTIILGLASAGVVRISGSWVDPLIALSLVVVALENLRVGKGSDSQSGSVVRLGIVFGFGLVHGFGFAGTLSAWIKPGHGFLPSLLCANLGVEAAQASLLAAAWILTMPLQATPFYPKIRFYACILIAIAGAAWAAGRMGLI